MALLTATIADYARFMALVLQREDGCWEWLGCRSGGKGNKPRYGSFWTLFHGTVRAHRFASEVFNGHECPPGHHRDHTCNNSLCVNPRHIEVVTHEENERRRQERMRENTQ